MNIQDFRGPVEFTGSTISQNIVNIPDIFNGPSSLTNSADIVDEIASGDLPQFNYNYIDHYFNFETGLFDLAVCLVNEDQDLYGSQQAVDRYLLVDGV